MPRRGLDYIISGCECADYSSNAEVFRSEMLKGCWAAGIGVELRCFYYYCVPCGTMCILSLSGDEFTICRRVHRDVCDLDPVGRRMPNGRCEKKTWIFVTDNT